MFNRADAPRVENFKDLLWVYSRTPNAELEVSDPKIISYLNELDQHMVHDSILSDYTGRKIYYTESEGFKPLQLLLNYVFDTKIDIDGMMDDFYEEVDGVLYAVGNPILEENDCIFKLHVKTADSSETYVIVNREVVYKNEDVFQNCGDLQWFYYHENPSTVHRHDMEKLILDLSHLYDVSFADMCS